MQSIIVYMSHWVQLKEIKACINERVKTGKDNCPRAKQEKEVACNMIITIQEAVSLLIISQAHLAGL